MAKASPILYHLKCTAILRSPQLPPKIHALINGKPWSPTKDELAATIRRHVTPMALPDPDFGVPSKLRAEWERLADEMRVAAARCDAVAEAEGGYSSATCAAEDAAVKTQDQLNECAKRIVNEPVRSRADLMLLAEATHWWLYTEPSGLWALEAEAQLAGHPPHVISGIAEEAVLTLLRGVRDAGMRGERRLRAAISPPLAPLKAVRDNYRASDWHRILSAHHEQWDRDES